MGPWVVCHLKRPLATGRGLFEGDERDRREPPHARREYKKKLWPRDSFPKTICNVDPQAYANLRETREEAQIASSSMSVYSFTSYPEMKGERF